MALKKISIFFTVENSVEMATPAQFEIKTN